MGDGIGEEKERQQRVYLEGLMRYHRKGIPIYIDGELTTEEDWKRLFEFRDDGGFYMGDYVGAETGRLREIRFDRIYLSEPDQKRRKD